MLSSSDGWPQENAAAHKAGGSSGYKEVSSCSLPGRPLPVMAWCWALRPLTPGKAKPRAAGGEPLELPASRVFVRCDLLLKYPSLTERHKGENRGPGLRGTE